MDQKKTLWIIAAVGVFLLVVVGAAMIIYSPSQTGESSMASLQSPNNTWTKPVETQPILPPQDKTAPVEGTVQNTGVEEPAQNQGSVLPTTAVDSVNVITGTTNVYDLGTPTTTIDLWRGTEPSSWSFKIWQKLQGNRKDCIKDKAYDSNSPVGSMFVGNNEFGMNQPGIGAEATQRIAQKAEDLPRLDIQNVSELTDNSGKNVIDNA